MSLFPVMHLSYKYWLKVLLIAASVAILLASAINFLSINYLAIVLTRILDGIAGAIMVTIGYYYVEKTKEQCKKVLEKELNVHN